MSLLLSADVGGTHCRFALFDGAQLAESRVLSTEGPSFVEAALEFLAGRSIQGAGVAVAGPVQGGRARLTNHHWGFDQRAISEALHCPAALVNDFHAAALGLTRLGPEGWRLLSGPSPDPAGIRVALGPGTGLGQAAILPRPGGWQVISSEGGHADLAPGEPEELDLLRWLMARYGHVSWERALSGPGLLDLDRYYGGAASHPSEVTGGEGPSARAATRRFCQLLGARAGDLALEFLPSGGVWICGGIPPRIIDRLIPEGLVLRFLAKGRFSALLSEIPLLLVVDDQLGLKGALAAIP